MAECLAIVSPRKYPESDHGMLDMIGLIDWIIWMSIQRLVPALDVRRTLFGFASLLHDARLT